MRSEPLHFVTGHEGRSKKHDTNYASSRHQRRNQKDSNDMLLMASPGTEATGFDCSDYNPGRNQPTPDQNSGFEDGNGDLDGDGGGASNDLAMFDLAVLCLDDTTTSPVEGGPTRYLCDDISRAKGQIIPYKYRVYLTKNNDFVDGEYGVVASSKSGVADESTTNNTLRKVEASIITYVSDKMGLSGCDSTNPVPVTRRSLTGNNIGRRLAEEHELTREDGDAHKNVKLHPLIGVTSDPSDAITGKFVPCLTLSCTMVSVYMTNIESEHSFVPSPRETSSQTAPRTLPTYPSTVNISRDS